MAASQIGRWWLGLGRAVLPCQELGLERLWFVNTEFSAQQQTVLSEGQRTRDLLRSSSKSFTDGKSSLLFTLQATSVFWLPLISRLSGPQGSLGCAGLVAFVPAAAWRWRRAAFLGAHLEPFLN